MKKLLSILFLFTITIFTASAQFLSSTQFGIKGGANVTDAAKNGTFSSGTEAGYQVGFYARFGDVGFILQPEIYLASKNISLNEKGVASMVQFKSIDIPLLAGIKLGEFSVGGRFYTGPVLSINTSQKQVFSNSAPNLSQVNYKDLNYGWQLGAGLDINDLSLDVRYEMGLNKQTYSPGINTTKIKLISFSLAYRIF